MKVSLELLFHFSCDRCSKWWTIADFEWNQAKVTCPHCGKVHEMPDKPTVPAISPFLQMNQVEHEPFNP
ncbi:MAG: hypothetical protein AAGB19_17640 [Cyanobacteria bacterium P01_F01_bin.3]